MSSCANIFIGCGGTGTKSLTRLNALLAEDPYWRNRIAKDVYYIIVDTEQEGMEKFRTNVRSQMRGAQEPYIADIQLSQGYNSLAPAVVEYFEEPFQNNPLHPALDRLKDHWWFNANGEPFKAPWVSPLSAGAGQVPAVSYFLAWMRLARIDEQFEKLARQITLRRAGEDRDHNPLEKNNLFIVSGLAGGTGRGCWNLLAFKFRQMCQRRGVRNFASPIGYFLDVSCFQSIMDEKPRQAAKMKINAITGLSELSTWMGLARGHKSDNSLTYRLPNMLRAEDKDADVLKVDISQDPTSLAPVNNAFLIFAESETALIGSADDAYDMVGSAIFARVTQSTIESEAINEGERPFWGVATSTFEIPADSLRKYFEWDFRLQSTRTLTSLDETAVGGFVRGFLDKHGLKFDYTDVGQVAPEEDGSILQRICFNLTEVQMQEEFAHLLQCLKDDEIEDARNALQGICCEHEEKVAAAVNSAFGGMESERSIADLFLDELYRNENSWFNQRKSAAEVQAALGYFTGFLSQELDEMPRAEEFRPARSVDPHDELEQTKGRSWILFGKRFDEGETVDIVKEARQVAQFDNYRAILEALKGKLEQWDAQFQAHHTAATALISSCGIISRRFETERNGVTNQTLFANAERPEDAILAEFSAKRFIRRMLKPVRVASKGEVEFGRALEFLKETLENADGKIRSTNELDLVRFRAQLEQTLVRDVSHSHDVMNDYKFEAVIGNLITCWRKRFEDAKNTRDEFERLCSRFREFFGVEVYLDEHQMVQLEDDPQKFIFLMGASLVETCRPFWDAPGNDLGQQVLLFAPTFVEPSKKDEYTKFVKDRVTRNILPSLFSLADQPEGRDRGATGNMGNAYLMLAYAADNAAKLEEIPYLDYWEREPEIVKKLHMCEDPSGAGVFDEAGGNMGMGYTDPIYVKNETALRYRWRPWDKGEAREQKVEVDALTNLVYALLEPTGAPAEKLAALGWKLPLLAEGAKEVFTFTRQGYNTEDAAVDQLSPWNAGDRMEQSLDNVLAALEGRIEKKKDKSLQWAACLRKERKIFWEQVAPKHGFGAGTEDYKKLLSAAEKSAGERLRAADGPDAAVWTLLIQRMREMMDIS